jgi:uncharacterized protein
MPSFPLTRMQKPVFAPNHYPPEQYERNMRYGTGNTLQVILKVAERCNIACKYCYFFFGGDESYQDNPAQISLETIHQFARFIGEGVQRYHMDRVHIIIHGGEPLMLKKELMTRLLQLLVDTVKDTLLEFSIQTNAMLIDDDWIAMFEKYRVYVGVSLDGPEQYNDLDRIDKQGRGTYQRVLNGVKQLFAAADAGRIARPGVLCVINPDFPAAELYHHFVNEIGFTNIDFLLPDNNHETMAADARRKFDDYTLTLLGLYRAETNPAIRFRFFDKILKNLTMPPFFRAVLHRFYTQKDVIFTVSSKGDIAPDDILRTTDPRLMKLGLNVATASMEKVLLNPVMNQLHHHMFTLPTDCHGCDFVNVCQGGDLYHRYHPENGFDNPSIYCSTLKKVYGEMVDTLLSGGITPAALLASLAAKPLKTL